MREIKFRCWDQSKGKKYATEINKMYEVIDIDFHDHSYDVGLQRYENGKYEHKELSWADDFILMQYTGLKDKNGKEIYEGDVVRLVGDTEEIVRSVVWLGWCWGLSKCYKGKWPLTNALNNRYNEDHEVIGNIYENPKLLKETA